MAETAKEIARQYSVMLESVELINEIIASGETDEESVDCLGRNKRHLILYRAKTYWTDEDMTAIDAAIQAEIPK
tara:strand:- start:2409 stop:2630 length:222 start_codon:yes stop_codon:yes gene_type:complete